MRFISSNIKAIFLVLFVILSEVIILPFSKIEHSEINGYVYSYGDVLYYFFSQIGYVSLLPAIFLYKIENNIDSKGIYLGLVIWNVFEVAQEFNLLLKLNIKFLNKASSIKADILQIIFIIFVICLTYIGFKKWNISSQP